LCGVNTPSMMMEQSIPKRRHKIQPPDNQPKKNYEM